MTGRRSSSTLEFISILLTFLPLYFCQQEPSTDIRFISYDDLLPQIERFSKIGVTSYTQLIFDIPRYQLLVGARDYIFSLSLEGLQKLDEAHWPSPPTTVVTCQQKGQSEDDCRNYIKVLLAKKDKIFACGTNAFSPKCSWRNTDSLSTVTEEMNGIGMCPYSPHQNITALIASTGDYYVGTAVDFSARDPAIYRFTGKDPGLRTEQYNHKWLSEPNFVSSFEINNFTYFFFRETAVEYINCGKTVYSRVARLCQNDEGGHYLLKDNWTTFLKARLNCSIPGEYPFYYNELQSVFYIEQESLIYASFTTPANSILGSAVCAYNLSAIETTFRSPFKYQSNARAAWEPDAGSSAARRHFQCETPSNSKHLDSNRFQLMDDAVRPTKHQPLVTAELERFSHIVVDIVPTKHHEGVHVLFIATMEGIIKKMIVLPRTQQTCLIEVLKLYPDDHIQPIRALKILRDTNSLYVGMDNSVIRLPVERCSRFKTKRECVNAMDPYCGWNIQTKTCTTSPEKNPLSGLWEQAFLSSCPTRTEPVDGGWGKWSDWYYCSNVGDSSSGGRCKCQNRKCNNPLPANGGRNCEGEDVRVSNCTRNGQWTEWSSWSACTQTCGQAVKFRRRMCGNPEPAFGGRTCVGRDRDEIFCNSNPPCPEPIDIGVDGRWSEWGSWSECTAQCGGGFQMRRRRCDNPPPFRGGRECLGCDVDHRPCNQEMCSEVRKASPWTPWLKSNKTRDGFYEVRFRFSCKANVPDVKFIRIGNMKKEQRFCLDNGNDCISSEFLNSDGDWTSWSAWTECSTGCGGGIQFRERSCDNPRPSGNGVHCKGESRMQRVCNTHPCSNSDSEGWEPWSAWSKCDEANNQHRKRVCQHSKPDIDQCQGLDHESRSCNDIDNNLIALASFGASSTSIQVEHLVAGCIGCFLLGSLVSAIICYCVMNKRRKRREIPSNKFFANRSAPPNVYVPPPKDSLKNNYNVSSLTRNKGIPKGIPLMTKRNGHKMNLEPECFE